VLIWHLSSLPPGPPPLFSGIDKIFHFGEFCIFGFTLILAYGQKSTASSIKVLITGIAYSCLDELHQWFIPGRVMEFGDIVADSLGIIFSLLLWLGWLRYQKNRKLKGQLLEQGREQ